MIYYYVITFVLSVLCGLIYIFKWNKRIDISYSIIMILIIISNYGAMARGMSKSLEEAQLANAISYIGACFLQVALTFCAVSLCRIKLDRTWKTLMILIGVFIYVIILNDPYTHLFYKSVSITKWKGITLLVKEYAIFHTVFYIMLIAYFILTMVILIYGYLKKKDASVKSIFLIFVMEFLNITIYFAQKFFPEGIQLASSSFVVSQVIILVILDRFSMYDVDHTVMTSVLEANELGSFSFSLNGNYLGCNEICEEWLPELSVLKVDRAISDSDRTTLFLNIKEWMKTIRETGEKHEFFFHKETAIYQITGDYFYEGRKRLGYQFAVRDYTKEQEYIDLLNRYNTELEAEVDEKTKNIREMHERFILGMADMVESRDNSTGHHIKRTSQGVRILISKILENDTLGLEPKFCSAVIKAAPMHDLGKLAVDDVILRKPARFTDEEFEIMKSHTSEGAKLVKKLLTDMQDDYFAQIAENVAHYHHERMDGTGYPCKLKGEEIPLEARIMAIADVYDALVSKRCYKESMSFDQSAQIILDGMGPQFDPQLKPYFEAARPELEAFYIKEFQLQ